MISRRDCPWPAVEGLAEAGSGVFSLRSHGRLVETMGTLFWQRRMESFPGPGDRVAYLESFPGPVSRLLWSIQGLLGYVRALARRGDFPLTEPFVG